MLGLRFLGIRARLLLLLVLTGLAGAFSLVPLLPSELLAEAYPRMALVVGGVALVAALFGRSLIRPLEELRKVLGERIQGRQVMPPPDRGHDEVRWLADSLVRFLEVCDLREAPEPSTANMHVQSERGLSALLEIAATMPGTGGAHGALRRLLDGVCEHLDLEHASLLILDRHDGLLKLHVASGLPEPVTAEIERQGPRVVKYAAGAGLAARALEDGHTQVALKGYRDATFAKLGSDYEKKIRNLACVPLGVGGQVRAVLNAVNTSRGPGFDVAAVDFLERAAGQAEGWLSGLLGTSTPEDLDPLTGVLLYDAWESRLQIEIERHRRRPRGLAVAVMELAFPEGEPEGAARNQALTSVGGSLRDAFRGLDSVGRDGSRFFLCLPETEILGAIQTVARLKDEVDLSAARELGRVSSWAAVAGVAAIPESLEDPDRLVAAAETALVAAHRAGDHRLVCFDRRLN